MCDSINLDILSLEDITTKHKKERKELQANIQALKKSAGKGDKKKKKEVLETISKLELELDERHANELAQLNKTSNTTEEVTEEVANQPEESDRNQRVSKAQKRRDKKAKDEKAKQAEILEQEKINKTGPRATELKLIKTILKSRNLMLYPIPSDGDCLYNAIRHQLIVTGRSAAVTDILKLRQITAEYILEHKSMLIFYMSNPATGDSLTDDEFINYCESIKRSATWGGQIEIKALSNALKVPIEVLQSSGPPTVQNDDNFPGPPLVLTFHRHMYSLGEHYNSTKCLEIDEETSSDDDDKTV
ncbi:Deubiquitinase OTUD6B [Pseudolycoriella hygida]|uniref:Deubiquitinase OTUD6B n=1 Tax=Pseudolycoriella hygida TaxID=35572 RepID=A0A9Q0RYK3_9DIPT|nr:Deubiquitinase OTUD6B [Pseudolycoriella hygida]